MSVLQAIIVGIVQGITEFLPISSDGHLVLFDRLLDLPLDGRDALGFDILLHAGSLLAILLVYRITWIGLIKGLLRRDRGALVTTGLLIVATIPGVIAGLLFEDTVSGLRSFTAAGIGFLVTGIILILGEWIGRQQTVSRSIGVWHAVAIGLAQAVAILPGVSRSGSTISTGRALGLKRSDALDFSFLMAAPIIAGAVGKTLADAFQGAVIFPTPTVSVTGAITSFIVSMGAITLLKLIVVKRSLAIFSWYVIPLGIILVLIDVV
jgi:undecaprenyl-diphosphatase